MDALEIKQAVEEYHLLVAMKEQLENRLTKLNGRNPKLELSIMEKLENLEKKIDLIDYASFEADYLTDKEQLMLTLRIDGYTFQEIGKFVMRNRDHISRELNNVYGKIAENYKES